MKPLVLPWKTYGTFKACLEHVDMVNRRQHQPMRVWVCRTGDPGSLLSPTDPVSRQPRDRFHRLIVRPAQQDGTPYLGVLTSDDFTSDDFTSDNFASTRLRWGAVIVLYYLPPSDTLAVIEQVDQVNIEPYQCWEEVWQ